MSRARYWLVEGLVPFHTLVRAATYDEAIAEARERGVSQGCAPDTAVAWRLGRASGGGRRRILKVRAMRVY